MNRKYFIEIFIGALCGVGIGHFVYGVHKKIKKFVRKNKSFDSDFVSSVKELIIMGSDNDNVLDDMEKYILCSDFDPYERLELLSYINEARKWPRN